MNAEYIGAERTTFIVKLNLVMPTIIILIAMVPLFTVYVECCKTFDAVSNDLLSIRLVEH